jgi:hypothetical protein
LPEPTEEQLRLVEESRRREVCLGQDADEPSDNFYDERTGDCRAHVETKAQVEFGLKIRFPLPGKPYLPPFAGLRFGVRTSSLENLSHFRVIVETGLGAW